MKFTLDDKTKIDTLVAFFQLIKNCSSTIKIDFHSTHVFMQGMDKSHVCLFSSVIQSTWFTSYENEVNTSVVLDTSSLYLILSRSQEQNILVFQYIDSTDKMEIHLLLNNNNTKGEYNRYFELPVLDVEQDTLGIPTFEYDADFSLKTKQLCDLTSQLILFGDILEIICDENTIDLKSTSENGNMKVTIPNDDLNEFSITEGETIELSYSLSYIHKMCLHTKLAKDVYVSLSKNYPIRIRYDLDNHGNIEFYVAPKMAD